MAFKDCHNLKYWTVLLVCAMMFNLPNYLVYTVWFFMGAMCVNILNRLFNRVSYNFPVFHTENNLIGVLNTKSVTDDLHNSFQKSEGWMLTYPLESQNYSPALHSLNNIQVVLVRINSQQLKVSYIHSKHKIPKKKVCDEKQINFNTKDDKMFTQHEQFDLRGAKIEIVPVGLCRKRMWRKKYPISISFASSYLNHFGSNNFDGSTMKGEPQNGRKLYLFARTDREKDDWYRRLIYASNFTVTAVPIQLQLNSNQDPKILEFVNFMRKQCPNLKYRSSNQSTPTQHSSTTMPSVLNVFMARFVYDYFKSPSWKNNVRSRVRKKLMSIRKPMVVESIKLIEMDLETSIPKLIGVSEPWIDSEGVWANVETEYIGNISISIEIKLTSAQSFKTKNPNLSPMFDSDAEDSGDESESELMEYADSFAKSSVGKWIVENIATTPIQFTMEIRHVSGVIAVNFPPVPSDRVWIGFRSPPVIEMEVKPKYGDWTLDYGFLIGFIKRKILLELQHAIVYPNMIDLILEMKEITKLN
ncbi:Testis-expressed sequence 2 protein [Orchesella cincta]|uniref:Testis-expressed sequence 2 protein n=1 Tax=Orchesella cincta TaxID=48709 RepID=A0A1D2MI69_ORCCI|nr:Testis-expressed sequence 2 protein [Orchesella cincta]